MNLMFSWQEQYLTRSLRSLVRYCSCHSNIKFISSRYRVISSMYSSPSTSTIYYKLTAELIEHCTKITVVLSVRYEVGVSLLLAPAGADKRGPKAPFLLVETAGIQPVIRKRVSAGASAGAGSYWKHCAEVMDSNSGLNFFQALISQLLNLCV